MLIERGFADANIGENLLDADISEAIAIETPGGGIDEFLSSRRRHKIALVSR
jgi:hypothetical protein